MIQETQLNLLSEGSHIEGKLFLDQTARIHGVVRGEVHGAQGSVLIFSENSQVEGSVEGDVVHIHGFVRGDVEARTKVYVSRTGRVLGNIKTPSLEVEFGAYFEGRCQMEEITPLASTLNPAPSGA